MNFSMFLSVFLGKIYLLKVLYVDTLAPKELNRTRMIDTEIWLTALRIVFFGLFFLTIEQWPE